MTIEPDFEPRNSRYHKRIVATVPMLGTLNGHEILLECGHVVHAYGSLSLAQGVALCQECRNDEMRNAVLVCMRLIDMVRTHPQMLTSICTDCGAPVGVYPSGQIMLQSFPALRIVCHVCWNQNYADLPTYEAPGARAEAHQKPGEKERN